MALLSTCFPSIFEMQIPAAKLCFEYRVLPHYGTYQGKYKISRRLLVQAGRKSSKKRASKIEDDVPLLQGNGHAILLGPISGALTVPALLPKEEYLSSQEFSNSQISPLNGSGEEGKQDFFKMEKFEMGDNIHNMDKSSLSLEEFLKMQQQKTPINARSNKFNGKMSVSSVATTGIAHVDEQDDSKDAANQNGMVEVWEGDLGPMTPEEEKELLARAQRELQKLEEMHPSAKFISEKEFIRSEPVGDFGIQKAIEGSLDSDRSAESSDETEKKGIPAVMRCFDRAKVYVKAGNGGNGVVAFRREKYVPFGGPSGGNGGDGGKVFIEADSSLNSLLSFRKSVHFRAGRGSHGQGKSQEGAKGEDCVVKVPPGTIVRRASDGPTATGEVLLELTSPGQRELLLPGGRGGRGNTAFKSGRNKAPILAESGEDGAEMWIDLELKLVADVGIIGVPNAGKSTLLAAVSAARPAIANYPFTTLLPNLGVVSLDFDATMVLADLPGLLEGAHLGYGLGHEFLRHTERCRVLVHVIDGLSQQPEYEYEAVRLELELFNPELSCKPAVIAYNKMDVPEVSDRWQLFCSNMEQKGVKVYSMSAATMQGTSEIMHAVYDLLKNSTVNDNPSDRTGAVEVGEMVRRQRNAPISEFKVTPYKHLRVWEVHGVGLERFTQMTNWEYLEAVQRFQRVLDVSGVNAALKRSGIQEGDTVVVGQREFVWHDSNDVMNAGEWERGYRGTKKWPH